MSEFFVGASAEHIKKERAKAKELRKSQWWLRKLNEGICYYCGGEFSPQELTMDHKVPLARGGFSTKANLVTACKECNHHKKYQLATEWQPASKPDSEE
ncbi:MAG: HNH endonuclease [Bdellovibrionales bacterium]|nr:HNH endonuclease [Bdellovibrionales bacterium]